MISPMERAQARLREMRAAGVKIKRVSRLPALKRYYRDFYGVDENKNDPGQPTLCRLDYNTRMAELRGLNLRPVVESICFECVGGNDDPGPKLRVRDCACRDCPLHPIRPWQRLKGRSGAKTDADDPSGGLSNDVQISADGIAACGGISAAPEAAIAEKVASGVVLAGSGSGR